MSNFKKARNQVGLSQKEIAVILKVAPPTVSNWERGERYPAGKNLLKLTKILNCTTDYLLGKTNNPHPPETELRRAKEKNPEDALNEYMDAAELSKESREWLLDSIKLLEIREKQLRNASIDKVGESG